MFGGLIIRLQVTNHILKEFSWPYFRPDMPYSIDQLKTLSHHRADINKCVITHQNYYGTANSVYVPNGIGKKKIVNQAKGNTRSMRNM